MSADAGTAPSALVVVRSYNVLAQGFRQPFQYYVPEQDLSWPTRRQRLLAAMTAGPKPSILCLQEVQSSTRGWGRLAERDESGDHAQWFRVKLAAQGYDGAYLSFEDDPRSSRSDPKNDGPNDKSKPFKEQNMAWPVEIGKVGGRLGVALFWDRKTFQRVAVREVRFSSHFMERTKEAGNNRGWYLLSAWSVGLIVLLKHVATGALVAAISTHLPTPGGNETDDSPTVAAAAGGDGGATPAVAASAVKREAPKGQVQQVQFTEALCVEVRSLLADLGLLGRVPIVLCGDFNSLPGSPAHTLLSQGCLPDDEPALHPTSTEPGKKPKPGTEPAPPNPVTLPYPNPTCAGLGKFSSAYATAAAGGGSEPVTTLRRLRRAKKAPVPAATPAPAAAAAADAPAPAPPPAAAAMDEEDAPNAKRHRPAEPAAAAPSTAAAAAAADAPPPATPAPAPAAVEYEELPPFKGCLDYIWTRNPSAADVDGAAAAAGGPPAASLDLVSVAALPTEDELAAPPTLGMPSAAHPSDHLPITATLSLRLLA